MKSNLMMVHCRMKSYHYPMKSNVMMVHYLWNLTIPQWNLIWWLYITYEILPLPNETSSDGHVLPCEISTLPYEISSDDVLPCEISTLPYEISTDDGTLPLKSDQMMELMIKNPSLSSGIVRNRGWCSIRRVTVWLKSSNLKKKTLWIQIALRHAEITLCLAAKTKYNNQKTFISLRFRGLSLI